MQESFYLRGVRGLAPASSAASRMHSRTGGAHTHEMCIVLHIRGLGPHTGRPAPTPRDRPDPQGGGGADRGGGGQELS